jgi:hypothetical protein
MAVNASDLLDSTHSDSAARSNHTVFVLVHGVGTHPYKKTVEVVRSSLIGLFGVGVTFTEDELEVPRPEPEIDDLPEKQSLLHVEQHGGRTASLLDLRWNPYMLSLSRSTHSVRQNAILFDEEPLWAFLVFWFRDPLFIRFMVANGHSIASNALLMTIRCRPLAIPVLLLIAIAALMLGWAYLLFVTLVFTFIGWMSAFGDLLDLNNWKLAGYVFLFSLVCGVVSWTIARAFSLFALVSDVVNYISPYGSRALYLAYFIRVIRALAQKLPDANLVLMGHSLGSVITSDLVIGARNEFIPFRSLMFVTAGSPMRKLAYWFPKFVGSAPYVLQSLQRISGFVCWLNVWRSGDFIGKKLLDDPQVAVWEMCAGRGAHWNYWADKEIVSFVLKNVFNREPNLDIVREI